MLLVGIMTYLKNSQYERLWNICLQGIELIDLYYELMPGQ